MNSQLFYWLANHLSDGLLTRNASDFRLMDRALYETLRDMDERNRFMRGLVAWAGFESVGVPVARPPRFAGESKAYTWQVIGLAFKGIFAHSYKPLRLITVVGFVASLFAAVALVVLVVRAFAEGVPFAGYGTIVALLLLIFGLLALMLGRHRRVHRPDLRGGQATPELRRPGDHRACPNRLARVLAPDVRPRPEALELVRRSVTPRPRARHWCLGLVRAHHDGPAVARVRSRVDARQCLLHGLCRAVDPGDRLRSRGRS